MGGGDNIEQWAYPPATAVNLKKVPVEVEGAVATRLVLLSRVTYRLFCFDCKKERGGRVVGA